MDNVLASYTNPLVVRIYTEKKGTGLWRSEEQLITRYFHRQQQTLDIGAGTGRTTMPLRVMGYPTVALDISYAMVKHAGAPSVQAIVTYIPFKDKTFANVLFSYNGICHLHAEQRYLCIQEVARVLKEKGIFLFTIESKEWYHLHSSLRTVIHAGSEKEFSCPFYRIQKKEVRQMLSELGFAILYEGYKDTIAKERDNYPNCYFFVASRSSLLR